VGIRARILGNKIEEKVNIKGKIKDSRLPQNKVEDKVNIKVKIKASRLSQNFKLEVVHKTTTVNHQPLAKIKNQHTHPMQ
jgi:hypothetical protein